MNSQRGAVKIEARDGKQYTMCLDLSATAELEDHFGVDSIVEVGDKLSNPGSKDVAAVVVCLLHGGGHKELTEADIMGWGVPFGELVKKIGDTFQASGLDTDNKDLSEDEPDEGN